MKLDEPVVDTVEKLRIRGARAPASLKHWAGTQGDAQDVDTLAQVPTWMCSPDAAAMTVTDRPHIALDATLLHESYSRILVTV